MLSRLIAIMVAMSFVIIPAYAEEGTAATETPAVARQDKPARVNLFEQLREAYEKNDREAMGKILDQMQERRKQMRQRRGEFRQGQRFREGRNRGFGQEQGRFSHGQRRGYRQMGKRQRTNQRHSGWHRGGGRFGKGGGGWNKPRCEHAGRRFGYGPRRQRHRWSDTDCEREGRSRQRSEWDW